MLIINNNQDPSIAPWKQILRKNFTKIEPLIAYLELNDASDILKRSKFPLNLPLRLAEKIKKNDLNDPILKQFLPTVNETILKEGFVKDPVGDSSCRPLPKLLHKYDSRVLLVTTSACAMHCRYCFRQNFDYAEAKGFLFDEELKQIHSDSTIKEVILSGGDPLSLTNEVLGHLIDKLKAIPHVKRIRFHTRFPIGIPERIDEEFIQLLQNAGKQIWFVLHINHPNELDEDIFEKVKELQKIGVVVLNQAVLLRGINDNATTLINLFENLVDHGVFPYYLHQLDRVQGASHFEVSVEEGQTLMKEIAKKLPGYAVPKYVREIEGEPHKTTI